MWHNKKWTIITVLAAGLILVAGILGGVAYAAGTQTAAADPGKTLMAKVATKLGVDQTKLENAFAEAQKEMQAEALEAQLKSLVEQGKMTQQQADQYKTWWQSRPALPAGLDLRGAMGPPGGFRGIPGPGGNPPPVPTAAPKSN